MPEAPANLSGLWMGSYSYPEGGGPTTPFLAKIEDRDGSLAGTIIEPNTIGRSSDELQAVLSGSRQGRAVDFTKLYDGESDAAHAVDYVGRVSGEGNTISGVWSLADTDGFFEMHREAVWEEKAGEEAEVVPLEAAPATPQSLDTFGLARVSFRHALETARFGEVTRLPLPASRRNHDCRPIRNCR